MALDLCPKKEIEDLLKKGAYGALMDDDNAGDKFCEEDIDSILERRAKTITIEGNKAGGSFSKATFASAETTDNNLDDPDFWEKWAKKAEIEQVDEKTKLMMVEPRSRKKTARLFGGADGLDPRQVSEMDSSDDSDGAGGLTGRAGKNRMSNRNSRRRPGASLAGPVKIGCQTGIP